MMMKSDERAERCECTLPAIVRRHPVGDIIDADAVQADEEIRLGRMVV